MTTGSRNHTYKLATGTDGWTADYVDAKSWSGSDDPIEKRKDNPYSMSYTFKSDAMYGKESTPNYRAYYKVLCVPTWSADPWTSNDTIALYNKLGREVNQHSFNAAVSLGEAKESLEFIGGIARGLAQAIYHVRNGNFKKAAIAAGVEPHFGMSKSKHWTSNWLALQFGLLPVIEDVQKAAVALAAMTNRPTRFAVRTAMWKYGSCKNAANYTKSVHRHGKSIKYYLTEDYSPISELGFDDPLPVLWNGLPYSFVADWFIPIGSYLQARGMANRLKGSWVITDRYEKNVWGCVTPQGLTWWNKSLTPRTPFYLSGSLTRSVGSGGLPNVPTPSLRPLSEVAGWWKTITSISLLRQRFR